MAIYLLGTVRNRLKCSALQTFNSQITKVICALIPYKSFFDQISAVSLKSILIFLAPKLERIQVLNICLSFDIQIFFKCVCTLEWSIGKFALIQVAIRRVFMCIKSFYNARLICKIFGQKMTSANT